MDKVRAQESPVGNLIADILMHSYDELLRERDERGELGEGRPKDQRQVDMAFICGGSLRGDSVFGPGLITLRDVLSIMPFEDSVIVRRLKGKDILEALENAFGAYPSLEGRFPQIAGLSVAWDSRRPKGQRLVEVRLLEDVHLFSADGKRKEQKPERRPSLDHSTGSATPPSEGKETYVFARSDEGGYSIEVNKPRIRKGPRIDPEQVYRVCTREYMGDGHDGYAALTRAQGEDIVDHENGALMSTQVRKFLLGASLIWRLQSFRESSDERGRGVVDRNQEQQRLKELLSAKTQQAVQRAYVLSGKSDGGSVLVKGDKDDLNGPATPKRGPALAQSMRVVVDSSPGGIRDAMHAGASEHHSQYDAASKAFCGSRKRARRSGLSSAHLGGAEDSLDSSWTSAGDGDDRSGHSLFASMASVNSPSMEDGQSDATGTSEAAGRSPSSPLSAKRMVHQHIEVSAQDGQALREAGNDLAVIAPLCDGRIVDVGAPAKMSAPSH